MIAVVAAGLHTLLPSENQLAETEPSPFAQPIIL